MNNTELIIEQTKKWITDVVIACNFCPFAAKEVKQNRVCYLVELSDDPGTCLQSVLQECRRLDDNAGIETTFLIMPNAVPSFEKYLDLLAAAEKLLEKKGYEGIYQVASFHPLYLFAGAPETDAANYTNRSPYPMLHLLREESIEKVLEKYPDPDQIPERNIRFAREKGTAYLQMLLAACMK
ncbi:MAG: DUF1415 domain-containing protein [Chitinophagaceae bacterium]|nr:DUF1415 domain-containing protein [Chitinophagaceae bacterium]